MVRQDGLTFPQNSGTCVATYEYDAWGNVVYTTDNSSVGIADLNPIRYRGYYYDDETELYYLQSRYYDPEVGRFINSDNITDSNSGILGYNTFIYCANNPVNAADPSGHGRIWNWIKRNFGFKSTKSTSKKNKLFSIGNYKVLSFETGSITKITTGKKSSTPITAFCNTDVSEGDTTISIGVKTKNTSISRDYGNLENGISVSCNSDYFLGEVNLTSSTIFTTLTITEYAQINDNMSTGQYNSYQINNIAATVVIVGIVFFPETAYVAGGAIGYSLGTLCGQT